jgi:hypothetical protein
MACQAASATASLREVLKASPLCRQRTLDLKRISVMALNSTRPERGTSLILYLGAVVMPKCSSRARSLPARTVVSTPKDSTSSASQYIFLSSVGESWDVGLSGATSSVSKGSSSCDASCSTSGSDSWGCVTFEGASWPTGSRLVLLRAVQRVRATYHLEREEYEAIKNLWSQEIR